MLAPRSSSSSAVARVPRAGVTTARVVETAASIVDEGGSGSLRLSAVAQQLGVSVPSLYKHVDSLAAMERLLTLRSLHELADVVTASVVGRAGPDALTPMCGAYRDYARRHPGRYASTVTAPAFGDEEHEQVASRVLVPVVAVLDGYGITGQARIDAARTLRSGLHGFVSLELQHGFGLPQDVDTSFRQLVAALDRALRTWP